MNRRALFRSCFAREIARLLLVLLLTALLGCRPGETAARVVLPAIDPAPVAEALPAPPEILPPPTHPAQKESPRQDPPLLVVSLQGAVSRPGVYQMPQDSRVQQLVDRGGGITDDADLGTLNPAARLLDGTTLTVPVKGESNWDPSYLNPPEYTRAGWQRPQDLPQSIPLSEPNAETHPAGELVDLNTATPAALETLPGVGPKTAEKIVQYREQIPFRKIDDLLNVPGIGEKKFEALRDMATVSNDGNHLGHSEPRSQ